MIDGDDWWVSHCNKVVTETSWSWLTTLSVGKAEFITNARSLVQINGFFLGTLVLLVWIWALRTYSVTKQVLAICMWPFFYFLARVIWKPSVYRKLWPFKNVYRPKLTIKIRTCLVVHTSRLFLSIFFFATIKYILNYSLCPSLYIALIFKLIWRLLIGKNIVSFNSQSFKIKTFLKTYSTSI